MKPPMEATSASIIATLPIGAPCLIVELLANTSRKKVKNFTYRVEALYLRRKGKFSTWYLRQVCYRHHHYDVSLSRWYSVSKYSNTICMQMITSTLLGLRHCKEFLNRSSWTTQNTSASLLDTSFPFSDQLKRIPFYRHKILPVTRVQLDLQK